MQPCSTTDTGFIPLRGPRMCVENGSQMSFPEPLDLGRIKVFPLAERESLSAIDKVLVDPHQAPRPCDVAAGKAIQDCAERIGAARRRGASVILMYGAHL